jgi:hypothetical protein
MGDFGISISENNLENCKQAAKSKLIQKHSELSMGSSC